MGLDGDLVRLREQRLEDIPLLARLRNDMSTQGYNKALPPDYTEAMVRGRFEDRRFSLDRSDGNFTVERKADETAIGHISYVNLVPHHEAMIGMALEPEAWGSGAAGEALELMLGFLFLDLGLYVAYLWTLSANVRAVRLAEKNGFRTSLRSRESAYKRGVLCDTLRMDILREEYLAPRNLVDTLPSLEDAG